MIKNIKTVTIVGAGSAGWMTAAVLIKFFPDYDIGDSEAELLANALKQWIPL